MQIGVGPTGLGAALLTPAPAAESAPWCALLRPRGSPALSPQPRGGARRPRQVPWSDALHLRGLFMFTSCQVYDCLSVSRV